MIRLKFDLSSCGEHVRKEDLDGMNSTLYLHHGKLVNKTGQGNDYLGWVSLPSDIRPELTERIEAEAGRLKKQSEIVVVIGIGGSYLGARAVIEALGHGFNGLPAGGTAPHVVYAGQNLSQDYHAGLLDVLDKKDYSLVVISKSGTTTEPAVAFRILKNHLEGKYGKKGGSRRIVAITDRERGALKKLAVTEGYSSFDIPDDVGGRYSVLTPVGLLPICLAGYDIGKLLRGARAMQEACTSSADPVSNPAAGYAAARNILYNKGKLIEILATYEPGLIWLAEWWKQLFGESEGKGGKGIFPAGMNFTSDLHSMGQYIQDGQRILFETVVDAGRPLRNLQVPLDRENLDGLNYLAGRSLAEVNAMAMKGTTMAHVDGGVPNLRISIPTLDEECLGELIYFFEFACGLSGYLLGINPFDQPGVEAYKNNMFALLGKPGHEARTAQLKKTADQGGMEI
jgi:glucose-6-phosphate isomerase